jgi:hypothetical protein
MPYRCPYCGGQLLPAPRNAKYKDWEWGCIRCDREWHINGDGKWFARRDPEKIVYDKMEARTRIHGGMGL